MPGAAVSCMGKQSCTSGGSAAEHRRDFWNKGAWECGAMQDSNGQEATLCAAYRSQPEHRIYRQRHPGAGSRREQLAIHRADKGGGQLWICVDGAGKAVIVGRESQRRAKPGMLWDDPAGPGQQALARGAETAGFSHLGGGGPRRETHLTVNEWEGSRVGWTGLATSSYSSDQVEIEPMDNRSSLIQK